MKKSTALLIIVLLLACAPVAVALQTIRHVDPAELSRESLLPSSFFTMYADIMAYIASENWNVSQINLEKASWIYLPSDLKYIASRFNQLLNETTTGLEDAKKEIDNATLLSEKGRVDEALTHLEKALYRLYSTNGTLEDVELTSVEIGDILKANPFLLIQGVGDINELIDLYLNKVKQWMEVTQTTLSVGVNSTRIVLGDGLRVNGSLRTVDGDPLPSMNIDVYFDDELVGDTETSSNGSYEYMMQIPYVYKENASLYTSFPHQTGGLSPYAPSVSDTLTIQLIYYTPSLQVYTPEVGYPSLNLTIQGSLTLQGTPLVDFDIVIQGLDSVLYLKTGEGGGFSTNLTVPSNYQTGLTFVRVKSQPKLIIGPSSAKKEVEVMKLPMLLEEDFPVFAWAGMVLVLKGTVYGGGFPLSDSVITATVGDWSSSVSSLDDGSFEAKIPIPLSATTSQHACSVSANPVEPWIQSSSMDSSVFVVNLSYLIFPLSAAVFATVVMRRSKKPSPKVGGLPISETVTDPPISIIREGLIGVYQSVVNLVIKHTGVSMRPSYTIREYLMLVKEKLGKLFAFFERLSLIAEKFLYSPRVTGEEKAEADEAADKIKGELKNEE